MTGMHRAAWICGVVLLCLFNVSVAFHAPVPLSLRTSSQGRAVRFERSLAGSFARSAAWNRVPENRVAQRTDGVTALSMASSKSPVQQLVIFVIGFGFLFGALYPLINNSLRFAQADKSMSGAATRMRQQEIDERVVRVPAFAVTDDKGSPYVAEYNGQNKGYFFLDATEAEKFASKVKSLQPKDAVVKVTPMTLDKAIKYVKSKKNGDPFDIIPAQAQVDTALTIKNPDTCDICWGAEGVKSQIPVFWIEGLGLERDGTVVTPLFFDRAQAESFYAKLNKGSPPKVEVFDLSATIKKMRKGGSAEFRKVLFYPAPNAVEYANKLLKASGTAPESPELFPTAGAQ
eukprot:CAMPEP_0177701878 /NCGR_PEP_ID=MMETSP0484_2-20121128/6842_1 /TAXON_ID=354590 /ORGANISM="Rhodomonas lens, Strain RHODO" /LENGTH=344 /DNA_ID=CAMNT_0019213133 /DNA_START=32 /DNA_END=1066 /DNA_ORIENTATION=+